MSLTSWGFDGNVALVTGAASGIGMATAATLRQCGLRIILLDRDGDAVSAVATELGSDAIAGTADVADEQQIREVLDVALDDQGLSYVAHCAGFHQSASFADLSMADWSRMLTVNLVGAFNVARACAPYLRAASGAAIVNVTSIEATRVVALINPKATPHYAAAKAGLEMLTKSLAHELSPDGVRVNAVAPGPVNTPMVAIEHGTGLAEPTISRAFGDHLLIKRYAEPAEIAGPICFLLSNAASYITATTVTVDGGFTAT